MRPADLVQVWLTRGAHQDARALVRHAEQHRAPIVELDDRGLAEISGSTHHEGLCIEARARRWASPDQVAELLVSRRGAALALDRVRNPYNVGALLRTAAFFGIDAVILGAPAPHPALAPDAIRVAEGGAEHLLLSRTTDLAQTLRRLKERSMHVVGADAAAGEPAFGALEQRPLVLVLGHEREGISERVAAECERAVALPGRGAIESLNVAVAGSVLIAELMREQLVAARRP